MIVKLQKLPREFQKERKEPNLLSYKDFQILVSTDNVGHVGGSVRMGISTDKKSDGLITDLWGGEEMIKAAEKELKKNGVKKVDAYYLDGPGKLSHYHSLGYVPERRTVEIEWDLKKFPIHNFQFPIKFKILIYKKKDMKEIEELFEDSFQPYWVAWKDGVINSYKWLRMVNKSWFVAYKDGRAIGCVDSDLEFGVVIRKGFGGEGLGSALLNHALSSLKKKGRKKVTTLATSGLDDYDPQIYLYTMNGGKIIREYINLQKQI